MKSQQLRLLAALLALPFAGFSQSAVPNLISYQGRIADAAGVLVGSTAPVNRIVLFRIYDSPNLSAPANRLYSEQQTVTIAAGEFSVLVGSGTAISTENTNAFSTLSAAVFGGATRYLGVTVDDGDGNPLNDPESSPRQQIASAPFAYRSVVAESVALGGVSAVSLANNSVTTAAIAPGAVTNSQLAAAAVDTTQVADNAVTLAKHAANSVDSSKIVDGSIAFADLGESVRSVMPKAKVVYNQGLSAFTRNPADNSHQFSIFPIDVSDLGVDGEVLISYTGAGRNTGFGGLKVPAVFHGRVRLLMPSFTGGTGTYQTSSQSFSVGSVAGVAPDPTTPFIAVSEGMGPEGNYSTTGVLGSGTIAVALVAAPTPRMADMPLNYYLFQRNIFSFSVVTSVNSPFGSPATVSRTYLDNSGQSNNVAALSHTTNGLSSATSVFTSVTGPFGGQNAIVFQSETTAATGANTNATTAAYMSVPLVHFYHYYPGTLLSPSGGSTGPTYSTQVNTTSNTNAGGAAQPYTVSSIVTGTNKLTVTVSNPHAMQVGDSVTLSGVTGAPAANGTFTVSAVPDRTSFEISLSGATGTYSGGTVSHQGRYNKFRIWAAVHSSVVARVTVSDF